MLLSKLIPYLDFTSHAFICVFRLFVFALLFGVEF